MAHVLLGITGSVAAIKTPELVVSLEADGHTVKLVATDAATYFFDIAPFRDRLTLDADEWPGDRYRRGDPVRHIELRKWADVFVLAPLDANTLAKLANGLCDNALTCVWRAWDLSKPVVLAPAMNTLMWQHPFTQKHLETLAAITPRLTVVSPAEKLLACGDVGVGAMAELEGIAVAIRRFTLTMQ
ncbi:phosphopantothenoylcysteine decarboxylase [soil metagenome]